MNRRKEILDELRDSAPSIVGLDPLLPPYKVPEGYFDSLPSLILLKIKAESASSVQEELEIISPLLSGITRKMPFSTPDGYFESLAPEIRVAPETNTKPAPVVKMFQPARRFRMAAAAVTIGLIGIAAWLFLKDNSTGDQYVTRTDSEVQNELKTKVDELSEIELANFVNASSYFVSYENASVGEISEEDVRLMLADLPDQELEKYLDQNTVKEQFN